MLVAPGPEVTRQTPTRPLTRAALRGVYGALFVPHEDVAQAVAVVVKRVVDGDDRASGIAENGFDALLEK